MFLKRERLFSPRNNKFSQFNESVSSIIINSHSRGSSFSSERWLSITVKPDNSTWFRWRRIYLPCATAFARKKLLKIDDLWCWWIRRLITMQYRWNGCLAREGFQLCRRVQLNVLRDGMRRRFHLFQLFLITFYPLGKFLAVSFFFFPFWDGNFQR